MLDVEQSISALAVGYPDRKDWVAGVLLAISMDKAQVPAQCKVAHGISTAGRPYMALLSHEWQPHKVVRKKNSLPTPCGTLHTSCFLTIMVSVSKAYRWLAFFQSAKMIFRLAVSTIICRFEIKPHST